MRRYVSLKTKSKNQIYEHLIFEYLIYDYAYEYIYIRYVCTSIRFHFHVMTLTYRQPAYSHTPTVRWHMEKNQSIKVSLFLVAIRFLSYRLGNKISRAMK